jgi:hypothetical protein
MHFLTKPKIARSGDSPKGYSESERSARGAVRIEERVGSFKAGGDGAILPWMESTRGLWGQGSVNAIGQLGGRIGDGIKRWIRCGQT